LGYETLSFSLFSVISLNWALSLRFIGNIFGSFLKLQNIPTQEEFCDNQRENACAVSHEVW